MSNLVSITAAFTLPALEIEALLQGKTIVAIAKAFTAAGRTFALYPSEVASSLSSTQLYRPTFLNDAGVANEGTSSASTLVKAWARCEFCQILDETTPLDAVSKLTAWTTEGLQAVMAQQQRIFLIYLRVYKLPQPVETSIRSKGQFVPLTKSFTGSDSSPVLSEENFSQRKNHLMNFNPPIDPELEELQALVAQMSLTNAQAKKLDRDLRAFLGWNNMLTSEVTDSDLAWISQISQTGNSSDGNTFEKLVRKSLIKLGFSNSNQNPRASLDPEATGGAGGIDVCCREPYPLVGECKASKNQNVPTDVCSQLTYLGQTHFSEEYDQAVKVIFAAGSLTNAANQVAIKNKMNVMRPETLQRLLELKAKYPGSIDLLALKPYLSEAPFGEDSDTKINKYIDKVLQGIQLRAKLVQIVKQLTKPDKRQLEATQVASAYNYTVLGIDNQGAWLTDQAVYELLIELSSPLVGYLGSLRVGGVNSDRFYYLRDLPIE